MARKPQAQSNEDRLIARHFKPIARHPGALGLIDDAAMLTPPPGHDLVVTADAIVGGVHFFPDDPADAIARKALRVNLSDLAAKGAKPAGFLLTLALPKRIDDGWLKAFCTRARRGREALRLPAARRRHGSHARTVDGLDHGVRRVAGRHDGAPRRRAGRRSCSGHRHDRRCRAGSAAATRHRNAARRWKLVSAGTRSSGVRAIWCRSRATRWPIAVRKHATAAMDVSDGLAGDLGKLCRASGVAAMIDVARVPLSAAARKASHGRAGSWLETVLSGGDDYEIVCTVRPSRARRRSRPPRVRSAWR